MKQNKRVLVRLLLQGVAFGGVAAVLAAQIWAAPAAGKVEKKTVVATIHPVAAILREIVGNRYEVIRLLPPASSPHTFEPRPSDLRQLENAAALFYVGPNLDQEWIARLPATTKIETLHLVPADFLLSMPADHHHEEHQSHIDSGKPKAMRAVDPHFWTDPLAVRAMLDNLSAALINLDPEGRDVYLTNSSLFKAELDRLHGQAQMFSSKIKGRPIVLFHPSFNYLIKRYDLFLAGLIEPVPGKEPTPRFLKETLSTIEKLRAKALFSEVQLADKSANVLAEAAGIGLYELDPIGGVPGRETYRDLILYNLQTLVTALQ